MRAEFEIPTTLPSLANLREHWKPRHTRTRKLRRDSWTVCRAFTPWRLMAAARELGATITLTRIALRPYDTDNKAAAFKPIQDGIADALQIDDGDRRLVWLYAYVKGTPDRVRVTLEVEAP